ncbi:thiosulfate sulfurtransferase GlpE [Cobetia sp. UIB-001]|uniref:thiosulfate sulfurtransferase GlpE n=1 Tax=Cobetia sp. UIB-001 TaxID=2717697 RepID=UPI00384C20DB
MSFEHLDLATLSDWRQRDPSLVVLDIRDPLSFTQGRIPGSRHLDNASAGAILEGTPRDKPLVVVCYHGHSSQQAAAWLAGQGFEKVYSLDGGFTQYQLTHGDDVESGS